MEQSKLGKNNGEGTGFYGSVIENADYLVGIEFSKERKKRVRVDVEDSRWDKTYVSFLVDLENYMDEKFGEENDAEEDPIYASFLEHLVENGKGYMLRDSVEHGVKIPISYEVETTKKKSPITRQSSKQKESHRKGSSFADKVEIDSPDTVKRYNTRACQGSNIPKKGSFDANKKLKSTSKNSEFVTDVQIDPSIVIKKEILRNCEHYSLQKTSNMVKSGVKNTKVVDLEAEADSLDEITKESSRNYGHYNLRKTRNVEAKTPLKPVIKNTKTVNEVEASSVNEINKETSGTRHGYSLRKRSGLEADKQIKQRLKKCRVEKDPPEVGDNSLDEISRETSRTRSGYNMRSRRGLEADKQLKPGLRKCKVEKDNHDVIVEDDNSLDEISKEASRTRSGYNTRKRSGLEADKQLKADLKKCKVEKDPFDVIEADDNSLDEISRETSRTRSGYNMRNRSGLEADKQLKPGLKKSKAEKDPPDVVEVGDNSLDEISRETSRTRSGSNMRKRSGLEADNQLKPDLKKSEVEKDPPEVNDGPPISCEGSVNRELKPGPTKSVFVNEKEGDPSQVIERNTSRTQPEVNIQKKGDLRTDRKVKPGRVSKGKGAHEHDETYSTFFAGLKFVGDSMVYEFGDRQKILYEGSAQHISSDSDDEAEAMKASPSPSTRSPEIPTSRPRPSIKTESIFTPIPLSPIVTPTPQSPPFTPTVTPTPQSPPFTPTATPTPLSPTVHRNRDKPSDKNGKGSQKKQSKLWRQLRRILGKPFDQNEFDELWREMNYCSEVLVYRDSRSGGTYKPGHMGKSYLAKYPELNDEIEDVKSDSCKVLNLLRMLAFYLKNVPHGIPRPWLPDHRKKFLP